MSGMSQRQSKKERREIKKKVNKNWQGLAIYVCNLPLRKRLRMAWKIITKRGF